MTVLNTTFVVDRRLTPRSILWLEEVYIPAAVESGIFHTPTLMKIHQEVDPQAESIALHLPADSAEDAQRWMDETGARLQADIRARWGEAVLFFTTGMSSIPCRNTTHSR